MKLDKIDKSLLRTLTNKIKICPVCRSERTQASLCDVPDYLIQTAQTTEILSDIEIDYYLYCPKCKEYSAVFCAYGAGDWSSLLDAG